MSMSPHIFSSAPAIPRGTSSTGAGPQEPLLAFICATDQVLSEQPDEATALDRVGALLKTLLQQDTWLADELAQPDPQRYRQYLLHADPLGRFSEVSFVWAPGQATPVHDHTVWGLISILRGQEVSGLGAGWPGRV
jgi:predicted metal-dependent enzyme (double-stranded beta helix superfamily)